MSVPHHPQRSSGTSFSNSVSIAFVAEFLPQAAVYFRTNETAMVLPQSSHKRQLLMISAAICAESGLLAYAVGYLFMAKLLGASSSAVFSWSSASSKFDDPRLARYIGLRSLLALALILVTTITLLPILRRVHLFDGIAGSSRTPSPAYPDQRTGKIGQPRSDTSAPAAKDTPDASSGIVLWPISRHPLD